MSFNKFKDSKIKKIFKYQIYHLISFIILGLIIFFVFQNFKNQKAQLFIFSLNQIIFISWISAGIFHAWILFFWRLEFYRGKIKKWFGKRRFLIFKIGFIIFGLTALLTIIPVSYLSKNTLQISLFLKIILLSLSTPFILWALYSVIFYFGINRAFGADHFFAEYRKGVFVKKGTFKYFPNSMYTLVLLILYHPGILFESFFGLIFAFCHHLFIWTHYYCTEKPDLKEIYKK